MKTTRDGQKVWPYCGSCGCRLEESVDTIDQLWYWIHFYGDDEHDARGCVCPQYSEVWLHDG